MTQASSAPIGVFDSGLGGLSVLRDIRAQLPEESLLYLADSKYVPYGERDAAFVAERTLQMAQWLEAQGCKALVIACNTATAHAAQLVRERIALPIVGVEPGLKPAIAASQSKAVGVLATANTLKSAKFARLLDSLSHEGRFICEAGVGLVPLVEAGHIDGPEVEQRLQSLLAPMLEAGADTLVLGCTHYPFLSNAIERISQQRLTVIDTGIAIARQLQRRLREEQLSAPTGNVASLRFTTTARAAQMQEMLHTLLQIDATPETVVIEPAPAAR
ncbi:glutamate racemase [Imbroritus primus]|jgi:glutamate racemase|uniref:Glutamate racemase n=1 Tax=Imbroritus primus TaxID=3058603 RepID=A0ACD3SQV0_9BURK|nr:glutamate racemase [Burkholderiaceae bacterium PBA]